MISDVSSAKHLPTLPVPVVYQCVRVRVVRTECTRCLAKKFDVSDINTSEKNTMQTSRNNTRLLAPSNIRNKARVYALVYVYMYNVKNYIFVYLQLDI